MSRPSIACDARSSPSSSGRSFAANRSVGSRSRSPLPCRPSRRRSGDFCGVGRLAAGSALCIASIAGGGVAFRARRRGCRIVGQVRRRLTGRRKAGRAGRGVWRSVGAASAGTARRCRLVAGSAWPASPLRPPSPRSCACARRTATHRKHAAASSRAQSAARAEACSWFRADPRTSSPDWIDGADAPNLPNRKSGWLTEVEGGGGRRAAVDTIGQPRGEALIASAMHAGPSEEAAGPAGVDRLGAAHRRHRAGRRRGPRRRAGKRHWPSPSRDAVELIAGISGRVIVTGVGKSGHIGSKIAATLASTGTPAFFVHPAEANHGDLGMIARDDAIIAMSWSGETQELKGIIAYSRRFSHSADRHHRRRDLGAGARSRRRAAPAADAGSLPAWAGADHLDAAATRHRRRAGRRAARGARLHARPFPRPSTPAASLAPT